MFRLANEEGDVEQGLIDQTNAGDRGDLLPVPESPALRRRTLFFRNGSRAIAFPSPSREQLSRVVSQAQKSHEDLRRGVRNLLPELSASVCASATIGALLYKLVQYIDSSNGEGHEQSQAKALLIGTAVGTIIGKGSEPISKFISKLYSSSCPAYFLSEPQRKRNEFGRLLAEMRDHVDPKRVSEIENYLAIWDALTNFSDSLGQILQNKLKVLTGLPYKDLILEPAGVAEQVETLLAPYSFAVKQGMRKLAHNIFLSITAPSDDQSRVESVFLLGPPGVGKTYLIKELANIFGIPCFIQNRLEGLKSEDIDGCDDDGRGSSNFKNGIITNALLHAGKENQCRNVVLFLDEIDRAVNGKQNNEKEFLQAWLLDILNRDTKLVESKTFSHMPLDITRVIVVMAGNHKFEQKNDALDTRYKVIEFPALTIEAKNDIGRKYFEAGMAYYEMDITERDRDCFDRIIANDQNPGVRRLQSALDSYISYRRILELSPDSIWGQAAVDVDSLAIEAEPATRKDAQTQASVDISMRELLAQFDRFKMNKHEMTKNSEETPKLRRIKSAHAFN